MCAAPACAYSRDKDRDPKKRVPVREKDKYQREDGTKVWYCGRNSCSWKLCTTCKRYQPSNLFKTRASSILIQPCTICTGSKWQAQSRFVHADESMPNTYDRMNTIGAQQPLTSKDSCALARCLVSDIISKFHAWSSEITGTHDTLIHKFSINFSDHTCICETLIHVQKMVSIVSTSWLFKWHAK